MCSDLQEKFSSPLFLRHLKLEIKYIIHKEDIKFRKYMILESYSQDSLCQNNFFFYLSFDTKVDWKMVAN